MPGNPHMPKFERNPAALATRFGQVMAGYPDAPVRKTFGSPCAYVNGNMAVGLHGAEWFVRLPPAAAAELLQIEGASPFSPMAGRPMTGYVVLPDWILDDDSARSAWIQRSLDYVRSLPPKEPGRKRA
jgi:TfoX/Sxy family transcriptional regulator of competence genes